MLVIFILSIFPIKILDILLENQLFKKDTGYFKTMWLVFHTTDSF